MLNLPFTKSGLVVNNQYPQLTGEAIHLELIFNPLIGTFLLSNQYSNCKLANLNLANLAKNVYQFNFNIRLILFLADSNLDCTLVAVSLEVKV